MPSILSRGIYSGLRAEIYADSLSIIHLWHPDAYCLGLRISGWYLWEPFACQVLWGIVLGAGGACAFPDGIVLGAGGACAFPDGIVPARTAGCA